MYMHDKKAGKGTEQNEKAQNRKTWIESEQNGKLQKRMKNFENE